MNTKIVWSGLVLIVVITGLSSFQFLKPTVQAPDVTFKTLAGKQIPLKTLKGKPVLVTFWATNCPSCLQEIPLLIRLYQKYHQQGLEIIAVTMADNPPNLVVEMAKAKQIPYHIALDLKSDLAKAFGDVSLIPQTFLISPDGTITLSQLGLFDMEIIKKRVENYLSGVYPRIERVARENYFDSDFLFI
jgi:thiol-disulfide isomerase/thioredoxin